MTLAMTDTDVTSVDIQKIQSGEPAEFQLLYRKFYDRLFDEATYLLNDQQQAIALVQLGCMQAWLRCELITSEQYYFGYVRTRMLRYAEAWSNSESQLLHDLEILNEFQGLQAGLF